MNWFTIRVQSNRERTVSERLKTDMLKEIDEEVEVLIPKESYVILKNNKKQVREKLLYPGYIFIKTKSPDKLADLIKRTDGAQSILKDRDGNPSLMRESEICRIINEVASKKEKVQSPFIVGEEVFIINGPFVEFKGTIESIDEDKSRIKVNVYIFGRSTSVELLFSDVSRVKVKE